MTTKVSRENGKKLKNSINLIFSPKNLLLSYTHRVGMSLRRILQEIDRIHDNEISISTKN